MVIGPQDETIATHGYFCSVFCHQKRHNIKGMTPDGGRTASSESSRASHVFGSLPIAGMSLLEPWQKLVSGPDATDLFCPPGRPPGLNWPVEPIARYIDEA
ncbi:hypothetical protein VCV18_007504 [Metarhizium anisopliae]